MIHSYGALRSLGESTGMQQLNAIAAGHGVVWVGQPSSSNITKKYLATDPIWNQIQIDLMQAAGVPPATWVGGQVTAAGGYTWYVKSPSEIWLLKKAKGASEPTTTAASVTTAAQGSISWYPDISGITSPANTAQPKSAGAGMNLPSKADVAFPLAIGGALILVLGGVAYLALRK